MADTKQQWYKDAKYGLFIHWGLYSILAGEWKDPKTGEVTKTDRIAEWIENNLNIDKEDYRKLKDEFHPDKFDADMFVKRAKEQWGVKYIVLTSKHHEGFAMYDSKVSDFNVVKAAGRDILRELSDACKKYDMTMGIYYSQAQDWDDDNAYKKDYEDKNEWKPEFRTYFDEKCKPQLKELLENYDNIAFPKMQGLYKNFCFFTVCTSSALFLVLAKVFRICSTASSAFIPLRAFRII